MSWQPFGYEGKPGTCLWCGRKLRYQKTQTWERVEVNGGFTPKITGEKRAELPGYYEDGFFCGLSCGYQYGVRFAQLGKRLQAEETNSDQEGALPMQPIEKVRRVLDAIQANDPNGEDQRLAAIRDTLLWVAEDIRISPGQFIDKYVTEITLNDGEESRF